MSGVNQKKYSIEDVAQIANAEGLEYAILHYLSYTKIEDPELTKQWEKAKAALSIIQHILEPYGYEC